MHEDDVTLRHRPQNQSRQPRRLPSRLKEHEPENLDDFDDDVERDFPALLREVRDTVGALCARKMLENHLADRKLQRGKVIAKEGGRTLLLLFFSVAVFLQHPFSLQAGGVEGGLAVLMVLGLICAATSYVEAFWKLLEKALAEEVVLRPSKSIR